MLYIAFAFNVLVLCAFVYELREARKERQALALLIKSESVDEFVRAEAKLAAPEKPEPPAPASIEDFDDVPPDQAIAALQGKPPAA
jgi:hypothetical protein